MSDQGWSDLRAAMRAEADQQAAALTDFAAALGAFFRALQSNGFERGEALMLTSALLVEQIRGALMADDEEAEL